MFPNLFTLPAVHLFGRSAGPFTFHTYGLLLAVAFLVALWVAAREARRAGLDEARVTDLAIYVLIAGLVGAKLMLLVVEWRYFRLNPGDILSILRSGGVFYGGFLAALPVAWWCARRYGLNGWQTADVLAPAVVLGQAIGRLGCLAAGCCHGRPASVAWAVTFRDVSAARTVGTPLDIPLHPTQIYESLACLVIFAALLRTASRKRFQGQVVAAYVVLYATARFAIEFFRGDAARGFVRFSQHFALSTSQFLAVLMLLGVAAVVPYLMKTQRVAPPAA